MNSLIFTGFPGFIGRRLLKALVREFDYPDVYLIVEPSRVNDARAEVSTFHDADRYHILMGDITQKMFGLDPETVSRISSGVRHFFHLAAVYSLSVGWERGYLVNVVGTENVVDFVSRLTGLERFVYFSTAYVAGKLTGTVYEDELAEPDGFKNHYEHTKFLAEQVVRRLQDAVPTTIIRPAIVIGDSKTGETDKFDGPYFVMIFMKRYPSFLPLPYIGKGHAEVNLIPVDFLVDATVALTASDKAAGRTFHVVDPNPSTARELYRIFSLKIRGKEPSGEIPLWMVKSALRFRFIAKKFGVPPEALPYFEHDVHFDATNTLEILKPLGITPPHITDYIDPIVEFFLNHYNDRSLIVF